MGKRMPSESRRVSTTLCTCQSVLDLDETNSPDIVLLIQETFQRAESPIRNKFEIAELSLDGGRGQVLISSSDK